MLYVVIGPPAAGKSTWVRQHAGPGDITIDYDNLATTLAVPGDDPHRHPEHVKKVVKAARQTAIDTALTLTAQHNVYLIHSTPSPALLTKYQAHGAHVVTIDPGQDTVLARAKTQRPYWMQGAIRRWYQDHPATPTVDDPHPLCEQPPHDGGDPDPLFSDQASPLDDLTTPVQGDPTGIEADGRPRGRRYRALVAAYRADCERDNLPCWLDQRPIDYTLTSPHPDSFSVDHAITVKDRPDLALDPNNFRPSHLDCNKRRGTREPHVQLGVPSEEW